jgi:hypothetical protein
MACYWFAYFYSPDFDFSGKKWKGRAVVFEMDSQPKKKLLSLLQNLQGLPAVSFCDSADEWKSNSQQYLVILRSMRCPG